MSLTCEAAQRESFFMVRTFVFHILLFQEGSQWVAHCLEYDIAAHGNTIREAQDSWAETVSLQMALDMSRGREPLDHIGQAPQSYWDRFKDASPLREAPPVRVPDDRSIPAPQMIRAYAEEARVC